MYYISSLLDLYGSLYKKGGPATWSIRIIFSSKNKNQRDHSGATTKPHPGPCPPAKSLYPIHLMMFFSLLVFFLFAFAICSFLTYCLVCGWLLHFNSEYRCALVLLRLTAGWHLASRLRESCDFFVRGPSLRTDAFDFWLGGGFWWFAGNMSLFGSWPSHRSSRHRPSCRVLSCLA